MFLPLMLLVISAGLGQIQTTQEPYKFFHEYVGLNDEQIQTIRNGKAITKVLQSRTPDEVFVFGSVYVDSTPESYLTLALDVEGLRKLPSYLAVQKFSDPPNLSDLDGFSLEPEDIKQLKNCKPGHCEIQLPMEMMKEFQDSINWVAPDRAEQVNSLTRRLALEALSRYQQEGNAALGTYRDKDHPTEVGQTFQSLLSWSKALPVYLPELQSYLLEYPKFKPDNIESEFYWERVNFGLKTTLRVVQAVVYRGTSPAGPTFAVAEKQLYATHYFETALDLTVCVKDPDRGGFYLITLKASQQAGLSGFKGGIVRKVALDRTRSSLQRALASLKQKLEGQAK